MWRVLIFLTAILDIAVGAIIVFAYKFGRAQLVDMVTPSGQYHHIGWIVTGLFILNTTVAVRCFWHEIVINHLTEDDFRRGFYRNN